MYHLKKSQLSGPHTFQLWSLTVSLKERATSPENLPAIFQKSVRRNGSATDWRATRYPNNTQEREMEERSCKKKGGPRNGKTQLGSELCS